MDTLIENGDFKLSQNGLPTAIVGVSELLQRARFCLCVPKGSFLHNKNFGSRFAELLDSTISAKEAFALSMAQESLKNQPQITAYLAQIQYAQDGEINAVKIMLLIENSTEEVIVEL
ncbi:MAG: hypothetical protein EOM05_06080 [Clostridia bacterium]|nr:hypothetical protein [Clostridia bacterium]